jgi:hypothetical protein
LNASVGTGKTYLKGRNATNKQGDESMPEAMTPTLLAEYETVIAEVGEDATDDQIVARLVQDADWTEQGAREVLHLARHYGTSILRNALALASAMRIEDGTSGL